MALIGTINASNDFGLKNRIINGAMVIDQRNAGASVTVDGGAFYGVDRWKGEDGTDGAFTIQQSSTAPAGFNYSTKLTITTADTSLGATQYSYFGQVIEGYNFADLGWGTASAKTVTLSFWVQSSVTGTYTASFINGDQNRCYPSTFTISVANTWEQKSITVAGDTSGTWNTTTSAALKLYICMGTGSTYTGTGNVWGSSLYFNATGSVNLIGTASATFYITGVQLEKGTTATSFDYRPYGTEFNLCQRYYSALPDTGASNGLGAGVCLNSSNFYFVAVYPVPMRTAPSFSSTGTFQVIVTTGYTPSSVTLNAAGTTSAALVAAISGVTGGNGGFIRGGGSACSLNFSAEL